MPNPAIPRHSIFAVIAYTLLAIGLARAALLVAQVPVLGYADALEPAGAATALPVHAIGLMQLGFLAALVACFAVGLRGHPVAGLVHALLVLFVMADPVATLWLNTPTTKPAALLGAYAVLASTAVILLREGDARVFWWLLGAGLVALGFSRAQFGYLPLLVAAVAFLPLSRRSRGRAIAILGASVAIAAVQFMVMPTLALPAAEPRALMLTLSRALPAAAAIVPGDLRITAAGPVASVMDLPPHAMSFVALLADVPSLAFATTVVALLAAFPAGLAWLLWTVRKEPRTAALPTVLLMLIAIVGYSLASTAFGGSLAGARSHNWLGALATLAAVVLIPVAVWQLTSEPLRARIAVAVFFGVLLLAAGWVGWTRGQPIAIGGIDRIETREGSLVITGWALDPWSVRRVYASVGGGPQAEGALGMERPDVERAYRGYPAAQTGGYEVDMPASAWRGDQELRVFVESRTGAVTQIAQRLIPGRPPGPSGSPS